MIFPYWEVSRGTERRLLPLIPITAHGSRTSVELVDSGAEYSLLGTDLAERLEISLADAGPVTIIGVDDHESAGWLADLQLQLGKHKWTAPVVFSPAGNRRPLLGQAGFFAFFTVTFRYRQRAMEIRRSRT